MRQDEVSNWYWVSMFVSGDAPEVRDGYDRLLCECISDDHARMMAAAPAMLEALKKARETIQAWHGPNAWEIYDRSSPEMKVINSAIAKAEGPK